MGPAQPLMPYQKKKKKNTTESKISIIQNPIFLPYPRNTLLEISSRCKNAINAIKKLVKKKTYQYL